VDYVPCQLVWPVPGLGIAVLGKVARLTEGVAVAVVHRSTVVEELGIGARATRRAKEVCHKAVDKECNPGLAPSAGLDNLEVVHNLADKDPAAEA
jgi:hypothetical protein